MKYHFKVHKEGIGCVTEADSTEELQRNMHEALNLYVEEPEDSKELAPLPDDSIRLTKNIVEVALDPQIAFAFMVRHSKKKHGLPQQQTGVSRLFNRLHYWSVSIFKNI